MKARIFIAGVGTICGLGLMPGPTYATTTDAEIKILPIDCLFEQVADGSNNITYLTPRECGVPEDLPSQPESASPQTSPNTGSANSPDSDSLAESSGTVESGKTSEGDALTSLANEGQSARSPESSLSLDTPNPTEPAPPWAWAVAVTTIAGGVGALSVLSIKALPLLGEGWQNLRKWWLRR